jgi:hypothetical protein
MLQFMPGNRIALVLTVLLGFVSVQANIVFVHLGAQIPSYVYVALEQARLFNLHRPIYLITNKEAVTHTTYDFTQHDFKVVLCEELEKSEHHHLFSQKSPLNPAYREGFWRKATERFFYLHELIASRNLEHVVHVESDNMLYVDIDDIENALSLYKGIGAVFDCDYRCIPSFVYIAHPQALEHFVAQIAEHAEKGYNDMEELALYRKTLSRNYIADLPLIMVEYEVKYHLINSLGQRPVEPSRYWNNINNFNSIFDGAALGQFLGGIDPRNGPSVPGFINETTIFNPSKMKIEWHKDKQGRKTPFATCGASTYRINNLHIHSKRLEEFRS